MGTRKRAWSGDRHLLWHRYVTHHLGGVHTVQILADDLSSDDTGELEGDWIAQERTTLVNWVNSHHSITPRMTVSVPCSMPCASSCKSHGA